MLAEVQTLKGRRFGNLVIAASAAPLPTEWLPRLMAAGPHPAKVAQGAELDEFVRGRTAGDRRRRDAVAEARGIRLRTLTDPFAIAGCRGPACRARSDASAGAHWNGEPDRAERSRR